MWSFLDGIWDSFICLGNNIFFLPLGIFSPKALKISLITYLQFPSFLILQHKT